MINHTATQPIVTDRLILRRFTTDDTRNAFEKWTSTYDSKFWEPPHKSIETTQQMISEYGERKSNAKMRNDIRRKNQRRFNVRWRNL